MTGCASSASHAPTAARTGAHTPLEATVERAELLAEQLRGLGPDVGQAEAQLAATSAFLHAQELALEYRVVRPALLHNILVNLGLRSRGLCFHWADDLTSKLESLHLRTLEIHRGVARLGTLREHSCVVLTAVGQAFEDGVILDAWRNSGRLHWSPLKQDKYPWIRAEIVSPGICGARENWPDKPTGR